MKPPLLLAAAAFAVAGVAVSASSAGSSSSSSGTVAPPVSAFLPRPPMVPPRQIVFFGYVKSLTRDRNRYLVRIDPAVSLTGITARRAAVGDGVIEPGDTVPNDFYVRNESRRQLTYRVPASAHVTVITNPGTGPRSTRITVAELANVLKGSNPKNHLGIWQPDSGFWVRVGGDTALALDQQYRP